MATCLKLDVGAQNVVLISIASVADPSLAPAGKHTLHAYLPGGPLPGPLSFAPHRTAADTCMCCCSHRALPSLGRYAEGCVCDWAMLNDCCRLSYCTCCCCASG